uniref:Uncharacterized protein n=1 Tax=Arundo donax TaxID=35708 RepID=A0A0A8Z0N7_ARUDO
MSLATTYLVRSHLCLLQTLLSLLSWICHRTNCKEAYLRALGL